MKGHGGHCVCGFCYPTTPQTDWTAKEAESVAAHQAYHLRMNEKGPTIPLARNSGAKIAEH